MTVSLTGGTIKDAYNNDAKLSCPIITGNTIIANKDGKTTTDTENQDKKQEPETPKQEEPKQEKPKQEKPTSQDKKDDSI